MNVWQSLARHGVPRRFLWLACALIIAVAPLTLVGQAPQARPAQPPAAQAPPAKPAPQTPAAKPEAPLSWADKILQQESYATPPPELAAAVTAPRYQNITLSNLSPDKKWFLNTIGDGPVVMATFAKPFHELGGVFIDFKANRVRSLTVSNSVGLQVVSAADGTKKPVAIPPNARVSNAAWSPDGSAVAYLVHTEDATHIWMTDLATNKPRQVSPRPLLATFVATFEFTKDGKQVAAVLIPDARPPMPVAPRRSRRAAGEGARRQGQEPAADLPEPDVHGVRTQPVGMARHRAAGADRRPAGSACESEGQAGQGGAGRRREEDRPADDAPLVRPVARRQVRADHAHDATLRLHRAGEQLRLGRRGVGPDRQGPREDLGQAAQPRHGRPDRTRSGRASSGRRCQPAGEA